jgi:putative ABC transport system permease protein
MIKHLCKIVWNRKRSNFLISLEIFISFLVIFAVMVFAVYYADNYRRPLGFNYENVWSVSVDIRGGAAPINISQETDTLRRLNAALREFPEVVSAASVWSAPYSSGNWTSGRTDKKRGINIEYQINQVSDDLPAVLGISLVRGRWFGREDDGANYKPVVINRQLSRDLFGDDDPIGKDMSDPEEKERVEQRVVGLIDDFRKGGEFADARGYVFQRNNLDGSTPQPPRSFLLKVQPGTTAAFEEKLLARLQSEAKDWSFSVKPLSEMRAATFNEHLAPISAFALVAGFLMIMVGLGLTGVLWQSVTYRTKEIGVRRAKGATAVNIYWQILGELLILATFALIAAVLVVVQFPLLDWLGFISGRVFLMSLLISLILVYLLTIICGLYPSRLATRVQPAEALHYE